MDTKKSLSHEDRLKVAAVLVKGFETRRELAEFLTFYVWPLYRGKESSQKVREGSKLHDLFRWPDGSRITVDQVNRSLIGTRLLWLLNGEWVVVEKRRGQRFYPLNEELPPNVIITT